MFYRGCVAFACLTFILWKKTSTKKHRQTKKSICLWWQYPYLRSYGMWRWHVICVNEWVFAEQAHAYCSSCIWTQTVTMAIWNTVKTKHMHAHTLCYQKIRMWVITAFLSQGVSFPACCSIKLVCVCACVHVWVCALPHRRNFNLLGSKHLRSLLVYFRHKVLRFFFFSINYLCYQQCQYEFSFSSYRFDWTISKSSLKIGVFWIEFKWFELGQHSDLLPHTKKDPGWFPAVAFLVHVLRMLFQKCLKIYIFSVSSKLTKTHLCQVTQRFSR